MGKRKQPFGYKMKLGEIVHLPSQSSSLRREFSFCPANSDNGGK